jgi:hypothetical protein
MLCSLRFPYSLFLSSLSFRLFEMSELYVGDHMLLQGRLHLERELSLLAL